MATAPLPQIIRVLVLEDDPADVDRAAAELRRYGFQCDPTVVRTRDAFVTALGSERWDVVLTACSVPAFSPIDALAELRAVDEDVPLIIVSGTIGEDAAVDAMRAGAHDCVMKHNLRRLGPAVGREVREAANRRQQRRTNAALEASEQRLRHAQKLEAVGRLAGGIAHDFNNLLTVILGFTELLIEDLPTDGRVARDAREIRFAAERASRLTRQLMAFSRQQVLEPRIVDLAAWLEDLRPMVQRLIGEDVQCRFMVGDEPHLVLIDPGQFEQVIINLVINARDAMPRGGRLRVELARRTLPAARARDLDVRPGAYVAVTVADSGDGIDPGALEQIFDPFFTTKPPGRGTGLGLSTVFGIVRQSGGGIEVETAPGKGTTFRVFFPHSDAAAAEPEPAPMPATAPGAPGTILLAEDEEGVRSLIEAALERDGHRVIATASGTDAVAAARRSLDPIDLLITDVVMPGLSGPDVASHVATTHPGARVLFLSGYAVHSALPEGLSADAGAFLQKPFTVEALLAKVRDCLSQSPASRPS